MIRVNLLEGTAEHRVAVQKTKVAARRGQQIFMLAAALAIFVIAVGADHLWTNSAHASAQKDLQREQDEAKKLEGDIQRKNDLEAELKQLEERVKVIKALRAEQKGPVAMLSAINDRMPNGLMDFRLDSIVQKGNHLQIIGSSLNQQVIADFAKQLEFSNNLFTNVMPSVEGREYRIEDVLDRKEADKETPKDAAKDKKDDKNAKAVAETRETDTIRVFQFTIDCDYNKPRADGDKDKDKDKDKKEAGK